MPAIIKFKRDPLLNAEVKFIIEFVCVLRYSLITILGCIPRGLQRDSLLYAFDQ